MNRSNGKSHPHPQSVLRLRGRLCRTRPLGCARAASRQRDALLHQYYPLHLAASYSFLSVSHINFESDLSGISTEGEDLEDLPQDPAAEEDDGSRRIRAQVV